jgi:nitrate reductase gamma subunit
MMETVGIWIAALLTLCIFSFLYKDNPFYRFAEHLFIGISAGYWLCRYYRNIFLPNLWTPLFERGQVLYIVPFVLGIMMLMRLSKKTAWISRWPLAVIVGTTSGYFLVTYLQSNGLEQVRATLVPLDSFSNIVLVAGVVSGLVYFFFSKAHKGPFGTVARVGVYFLMIAFGASFGYTVMARISLLFGRMYFLLSEWLRVVG